MAELQRRVCNVSGKPTTVSKYCDFTNTVSFLTERKKLRFIELQTSGSLGDNGESDRV